MNLRNEIRKMNVEILPIFSFGLIILSVIPGTGASLSISTALSTVFSASLLFAGRLVKGEFNVCHE